MATVGVYTPLLLLCACTAPGSPPWDTGAPPDTGDPPAAPATGPLDWSPCSLRPGTGDRRAWCATAEVPLDHDDPGGPTLTLALKRLVPEEPPTAMLWLLDGGPGASALDDFADLAQGFPEDLPTVALYAVDHRGVGGSGRLSCPAAEGERGAGGRAITEEEWPGCVERLEADWGDSLGEVTTTAAALDLALLIDRLRAPGQAVYLWGGSYGTYLAQRHLQLRPDQVDAVVIDSIAAPGLDMADYDRGYDAAGRALLARCAADDRCRGHLGDDPVAYTADTIAAFDAGHCPRLGVDGDFVRQLLAGLLGIDPVRDVVPAVITRLRRCDDADVEAVRSLYTAVWGASVPTEGNTGEGRSEALFVHIAASELCAGRCEDAAALAESEEGLLFATGLGAGVAELVPIWPRYPPDTHDGAFSDYDGPMLMLQGGLDPATPGAAAEAVRDHYIAPHQTWAWFPDGAHLNSAGSALPDGSSCAYQLARDFLGDPTAPVDLACIEQIVPIDFDGDPALNRALFGDDDAWGG